MNARIPGRHLTRALVTFVIALLAVPSAALAASSGGGGLSGTGTTGTTGTANPGGATTIATSTPATPVSTTSNGITVRTSSSALLRQGLRFTGTAPDAVGQTIEIEREGRATHGRWVATATATVSSAGTFTATWHASQVGRFSMSASVAGASEPQVRAHAATASSAALTISVYRTAKATIYGPGLYGKHTACGQKLTPTTLGVANRSLPCGTQVSIFYDGQTLTVPVIDRGPYANGASWDLTTATAAALGMDGTEQVGTLSLPGTSTTAPATGTAPTTSAGTTTVPGAQVLSLR